MDSLTDACTRQTIKNIHFAIGFLHKIPNALIHKPRAVLAVRLMCEE